MSGTWRAATRVSKELDTFNFSLVEQVLMQINIIFKKSIKTEKLIVSSFKVLLKKKAEHDLSQGTCMLHFVWWVIIQSKRKSFVKRNLGFEDTNAFLSTFDWLLVSSDSKITLLQFIKKLFAIFKSLLSTNLRHFKESKFENALDWIVDITLPSKLIYMISNKS